MGDDLILLKLAARFQALGSTQRLRIIHLLVVEGEAGLNLAELAQRLSAKPGAIRRQLRVLEGQDMIELVCSMSPPRYRPRRDIFRDLFDYVSPARSGQQGGPEYPLPSCCWRHP